KIGGSAGQAGHARAGEWAETVLTATNQGNLTDQIGLNVENLPAGWNYKFQHMTGSMIPDGVGIQLTPGESRNFKLLVQPAEGAALGSTSVTVKLQSSEASVSKSFAASFVVDPDFEPTWTQQDPAFYCLPGNLCDFEITLNNEGDAEDTFSLSSTEILTHDGWAFGMHYEQSPIVTIAAGASETIELSANLPASAMPGMRASTSFVATSQTDASKSALVRANVTASMVSAGHVGINPADVPAEGWWVSPGETITIPFTIWNNASQQDTYAFSFDTSGVFGWTIGMPSTEDVVIAPSGTAVVWLSFTAPTTAQANDPCPIVTPHAISTASGMSTTESTFSSIRVTQHHELNVTMLAIPNSQIRPGVPVELSIVIENLGNGADSADVDMELPHSWEWWVEMGGSTIHSDQLSSIPLTTVHDGNNEVELSLWILAPSNEQPGDVFDLELIVTSSDSNAAHDSGSHLTWQYQTMRTAFPYLEPFSEQDVSAWLEQSLQFNLVVANTGNTYDGSMRVRVRASTSNYIAVSLDSERTGVQGTLNTWVNLPMSPGINDTLTITFVSTNSFTLGDTVQLTVDIEGGVINANDVLISSSTTVNISVDQKREIAIDWDLISENEIKPNQPTPFNIDVSSESTMSVRVNLESTIPDDALLDCTPILANGTVELLLPAADSEPQTGTIECEITLSESDLKQTITLHLHDENGEVIWNEMVHLKTEQSKESGGSFGSFNVEIIGIISGILFVVFVIVMAAMIVRRRSQLDELEYEDIEEGDVETLAAPQTQPVHSQQYAAPGPMPGAPGPMPAAQVVQAPVEQNVPTRAVQTEVAGPESYTDEQLRSAGWNDAQIAELRGSAQLSDAFGSLQSEPEAENVSPSATESSLPTFNCIVTGMVLTTADSWWQCSNCGGFAESGAVSNLSHCPSCNSAL
ncbi:MAG: hypothetical protein VX320_06410, partial [Candidatus Thermoplasmatota archaeon]|nr:hypothetical protein [Candidatus Thermoplasmatota archaeon]